MHVVYVLPKQFYFAEGTRGRVTHAAGLIAGLIENDCRLTVLSGEGVSSFVDRSFRGVSPVEIAPIKRGALGEFQWSARLVRRLDSLLQSDHTVDAVVTRYGPSNAYRFRSLIAKYPRVVWCFEINSLAYHQFESYPLLLRRAMRRLEWTVLSRADILYTISRRLARDLAVVPGAEDRIAVVPNAGNISPFSPRPGSPNIVRFVYFGIFQSYYDIQFIVRAFTQLRANDPRVELHLLGDGPQLPMLKRIAEASPGVFFHGRYEMSALLRSELLDTSSVLVLPCKASEGGDIVSPIKLFEYMSLGLPILASEVGQATEILKHGETVWFYDPGEQHSCVRAMEHLAREAELRQQLGRDVRAEFEAKHTWVARMRGLRERFAAQLEVKRHA